MANRQSSVAYHPDENFIALEKHYKKHPIVLYTGAGVSRCSDTQYGLGGWEDLVGRIAAAHSETSLTELTRFRDTTKETAGKPWLEADCVADRVGPQAFEDLLKQVVREDRGNFRRSYRQLSGRFVSGATTLNAVAAFCAEFVGIVCGTQRRTYRVSANRRVSAVLTTNYDVFLEAASSTMFQQPTLKPVGAKGSHAGNVDEIPVFHVHGYVPFPERKNNRPRITREALVDPVMTSDDYCRAWRKDDVYCPTMGLHVHLLRHYVALFIGVSFRDEPLRVLLTELNEERKKRMDRLFHYAVLDRKDAETLGKLVLEQLGVKPVVVADYSQIPELLGRLYERGLRKDFADGRPELPVVTKGKGARTGEHERVSTAQYWDHLKRCRNRAVGGRCRTPSK